MRILLILGLLATGTALRGAAPAAPADRPYRLLVALRFSEDPVFTSFFSGAVERQARDQLANFFGSLAEVQVAVGHPLFEKLAPRGLDDLTLAPEQFAAMKKHHKVFLVQVDFDEGMYRIRSRQLDGEVEDVGLLHHRDSPDRHWLVKALCLAVKEDFAPVAEVEPIPGKDEVRLRFHGAGHGDRLSSWLKDGCVLQPYRRVYQAPGILRHERIRNVVLRVAPGSDGRRAVVVSSRGNPWQRTARIAGFQAIKLTTQSGCLRLRLISAETGEAARSCMVYANSRGFDETTDGDRLSQPNREGWVVAAESFDQVAFITLKQRQETAIRILLPITADWVEQTYRIPVDKRSREKDQWQRRIRYCAQDVRILQGTLEQYVQEINASNKDKRYEEALKQTQAAVTALQPMLVTASNGIHATERDGKRLQIADNSLLRWAKQQLRDVEGRQRQLQELVGDLEQTLRDMNARNRAKVLLNLAGQAEQHGNIDEAIAQYERALQEVPDQSSVKEHLDQLREDWKIKSPEHQDARDFVFQTLAKAQTKDIKALLPRAKSAFSVLRQWDDYLSLRMMLQTIGGLNQDLADVVDALADRESEEDRREFENYDKLTKQVLQFQEQILNYLKARAEKPVPAAAEDSEEKQPKEDREAGAPGNADAAPEQTEKKAPAAPKVGEEEEPPLEPDKSP
ncbi:MAG: hypothetical protein JXB10_04150 [Pirellulales bacterium]|nr:hypothetical protein [Pirellulales bacterium]